MRSNDTKTIWVTGANGQLGRSLRRVVEDSDCCYLFTDVAKVDITDRAAVDRFVDEHRVDVVINCAAYTQVNRAEKEEPVADRINREAVEYLARVAQRLCFRRIGKPSLSGGGSGCSAGGLRSDKTGRRAGSYPKRMSLPDSPYGVALFGVWK